MKKTLSFLTLAIAGIAFLGLGAHAFAQASPVPANGASGFGRSHGMMHGGTMQRPAVMGTVTAVNGNTLTVTSNGPKNSATTATVTTYTVDATNAKITKGFGKNASTITASSVAIGDHIAVTGTISGTSVTATSVVDFGTAPANSGMRDGVGMNKNRVMGKVTAISGTTLTISGRNNASDTINAANAAVTKGSLGTVPVASSLASIAIGDTVAVTSATPISGTSIIASTIVDFGIITTPNPSNYLIGTIASVNGTTFTVTTHSWKVPNSGATTTAPTPTTVTLVTTSATTVTNNNVAGAVSSLAAGQMISARGTLDASSNTFTATSIRVGTSDINGRGHDDNDGSTVPGSSSAHRGFFQGIGNFFKKMF